MAYARKDLKANVIIDIATLTGAQGPATGRLHGAVLTNNEKWEKACVEIGRQCGDLCFPIVFAPEIHFSEFKSEVADMTNSVKVYFNVNTQIYGFFKLKNHFYRMQIMLLPRAQDFSYIRTWDQTIKGSGFILI